MTAPACSVCRFSDFQVIDTIDQDDVEGETPHRICRRHPPTMVAFQDAASPCWPVVHDQEWCGEFEAAP